MREPAVAGQFYPDRKDELMALLSELDSSSGETSLTAIAGVSPHAGYIYSGRTAAKTFKVIRNTNPKTLVIIGPDHVGVASYKNEIAVYNNGNWITPIGEVKINKEIANKISESVTSAVTDPEAHAMEHSIEVQLPLAQYFLKDFDIVPIMLGDQSMSTAAELGKALADILPENTFVLASSDFSHYVPVEEAEKNDKYAIEAITNLDVREFYKRISEKNVSACGYGAIATAAVFASERGATRGILVDYSTSSDVTGEPTCVGYASIIFT